MADIIKANFRATSGFDAAGEKVINVAKAAKTELQDAVNVQFFIEENTVQAYDPNRGYELGFAVIFNNRIWTARQKINFPAGNFNPNYWKAIRTDPKWELVETGPLVLEPGQYISGDTSSRAVELTLPNNPQDGDTIFVRDIGGYVGINQLLIKTSVHQINYKTHQIASYRCTVPYSQMMFVFNNKLWQLMVVDNEQTMTTVIPGNVYQAQAGDHLIRRYTTAGTVHYKLPKYANNGDTIYSTDIDRLGPLNHLIVSTYDDNTSIGSIGNHEKEFRTSGNGYLVYDESNALWRIYDADPKTRLKVIIDNYTAKPNESLMVLGENNVTPQTITITLPTAIEIGDTVQICLSYLRLAQTCIIKTTGTDLIASTKRLLQFPRRSEYPPDQKWYTSQTLEFKGYDDYAPTLELAYLENADGTNNWVVAENIPIIERVDAKDNTTRARLGVIALATQDQANKNHEESPAKELAITPETLANRVATETRRGIARIATTAEVNKATSGSASVVYDDDTIITPKKLDGRVATEDRRGLAEIATQSEVTAGTDDTTIVTPKKFNARKATEILDGIIALVKSGATPAVDRDNPGSNVYDYTNHTKAVTPKTLWEAKSTPTTLGLVYIATENEVIDAPADKPLVPTAVTPMQLHKKTATTGRIGFTQTAIQTEVNTGTDNFKYVTPATLNGRKASDTLTGIARFATLNEFKLGTAKDLIVNPFVISSYFSDIRTSVVSASGLVESGNLWNHYNLDIQAASDTQRGTARLATQGEVNAGTNDATIITPAKLAKKKATESVDGIVKLANQAETVAGTSDTTAVDPKNLKYVIQQAPTWDASATLRGPVKLSENTLTWSGNDTVGSIEEPSFYPSVGYAISPSELNRVLKNYLPLKAKAADSDKLDNLDSTQFIRRDIAQDVNGILTLKKQTNIEAPVISSSTGLFSALTAKDSVIVGDSTKGTIINMKSKANDWKIEALADSATLDFNDVLKLNRNGDVSVKQSLDARNSIKAAVQYILDGKIILSNDTAGGLQVGNTAQKTTILSSDASNVIAKDANGTEYKVLTEKNAVAIVGKDYVKKIGDTMTGRLTVNSAITVQINETYFNIVPNEITKGMWSAEIKTKTIYDQLPGYVVPITGIDQTSGRTIVVDYTEHKGPGTLSQFGVGTDYAYQIWNPRPLTAIDGHNAKTQWVRNYDSVRKKWEDWGRVFNSQTPPLASDIGAASSSGSIFTNLRIREWIQIGNVRIKPNPDTESVDFEWIP